MRIRKPLQAAVLAAVATGLLTGGAGAAETFKVKARENDSWRKVHTYIGKGDTVKWSNPTGDTHDINATSSNWSVGTVLAPGDRFKQRFRKRGTFSYRCERHSGIVDGACQGMCGFVHVVG